MNIATRNDILGIIDYLNDAEAFDDNTVKWHNRCIAWITEKLEQETTK